MLSFSPRISTTILLFVTSCPRPSIRCFVTGIPSPEAGDGRRRRRCVLRVRHLPKDYDVAEFVSSSYMIERINFSPNSVDLRFFRPIDAEERKGRWKQTKRYKDEQMSFVGPSRPMVDAGIIARIGAWHASRRLEIPGQWTIQTLQDLFTPYGALCFTGVRENRGLVDFLNIADAIKAYEALQHHNVAFRRDPNPVGTTPRTVHITGIQKNQVEDYVLSSLRAVRHSTGLSLRHDADKETMDIEFFEKDEANTFLSHFQPIAEQKIFTATAVETPNLHPMMVLALNLGARRALWIGLRNKKAKDATALLVQTVLSQFGEVMFVHHRSSVRAPYSSLVVFFTDVYAAMNALIGLEKGGHLLSAIAGCEVSFAKWEGIEDPPGVQRTVISGPTVTIPVPSEESFVEVPQGRREYRYTLSSLLREENAKPWQRR
ncbi:uncharacterized protein BT62DRAFT_930160 [Guyanagaster necrorhizus]|uniref:Uncharacterized protein n=1 Tax=Guyanagaster necrorhizus TaxID=856835 RepID=A0A9P7VXL8_9AGAR|nr:uncharacterized protein BT62DRAFT_930160 [Guyanagaster necrorhizus MCA 3950]KAG7448079.1 hypothetical protein BT62DRAFT_930160 [Guyanagaster necrorhizus MCA 3950]